LLATFGRGSQYDSLTAGETLQPSKLIFTRENPSSWLNATRTAVEAIVSYPVARLFGLPEAYWAAIPTLIVMQSTLGAALPVSVQRFAGTAIGGRCWGRDCYLFLRKRLGSKSH
jgi:uncharacterized membrane protein YccC